VVLVLARVELLEDDAFAVTEELTVVDDESTDDVNFVVTFGLNVDLVDDTLFDSVELTVTFVVLVTGCV
jgi:hypothetical protein